jgi:hypothetical protein
MNLLSEDFNQKVSSEDLYTVRTIVAKLIKHNYDSIKELPELFEVLDDGETVDIKDLLDSYV